MGDKRAKVNEMLQEAIGNEIEEQTGGIIGDNRLSYLMIGLHYLVIVYYDASTSQCV